ncbi:MAG: ATP-binding protein [Phycisphaerae bacterium]|nr:ATP-binding protein [Phycisphaerae bacterium]
MIKRHLSRKLLQAIQQYPIVSLTGPRQSGKTTLLRHTFSDYAYVSLEDPDLRAEAITDPRGFLEHLSSHVIIDEAQQAPDLFSYIQGIVDRTGQAGQFVLSGSQNFLLMEKISQSLAGRCAILHLMPFSLPELLAQKAMNPDQPGCTGPKPAMCPNLYDMLTTGFYPPIHDRKLSPPDWLANYYMSYIERDVRQITNVGDIEAFNRFVRLCAGRHGQILNMSSLAGDSGVSTVTVKRWLSILDTSFIIKLLRPHHKNFNKRLIKSPKLYFLDSGLLCYLLRIRNSEELQFHAMRGAIFEGWVISELYKNTLHQGLIPDLYYWRDSNGHEIDLLVDHGSQLIPIEIKSGQTLNSEFFRNLHYFQRLTGPTDTQPILVYGGDRASQYQGVNVIPWYNWR